MANTKIDEVKELLGFLHSLYISLWQLHINGRKPDLAPVKFVLRPASGLHSNSLKEGERVYRESAELLYGMFY